MSPSKWLFAGLMISFMLMTPLKIEAQQIPADVGLQLWSVRDDMSKDPLGTLERVGQMGYSFIEAAGYRDGLFYGLQPGEFKAASHKAGLQFRASHAGYPLPGPDEWEATMAWWDQCIEAHVQAGVSYIIQPSMDEKGYGALDDLKRYCDYFNAIGKKCHARGVQFGYHNHDKEFGSVDGVVRYDFMLDNTDPELVVYEIDLYWIKVGGKKVVEYFDRYPGRFVLWHVKDEKELGASGTMDFKSVFEKAALAGLKEVIVEVEQYNYEPLESVHKSLDYLRQISF